MFCPVCWKEYPKGMQHCDSCRAELIEGMPEGHAPVVRELVVPVIREEKIVAILGVGNKQSDYVPQDVETVAQSFREMLRL